MGNDKTARTPGPWQGRNRTDGLVNIYMEGTQHDVALCCKPQDATFIITACNAYHELIEEAKR